MFGLRCLKVLRTVDFHNQLHDRGVEIDDVVTDWFLSIELHCEDLLSAVGEVAWVDAEAMMDAVTAVSGSGPAYVFLLAEALAAAGERAGLDKSLARQLAIATVSGAGELMHRSNLDPKVLRAQIEALKGFFGSAAAKSLPMGVMADADWIEGIRTMASVKLIKDAPSSQFYTNDLLDTALIREIGKR